MTRMAYPAGLLNSRVAILSRRDAKDGRFGREGGKWVEVSHVWANVKFVRGARALSEGAIDAYQVIMVRMRHNPKVTRECRLRHRGVVYQIDSFNEDPCENIMQITCTELRVNPEK